MQFVSSVFSGDKYESRSECYTYIPTINIINKLRDEGGQPFLLPVTAGFVILGGVNTVNICYVFTGKDILTG